MGFWYISARVIRGIGLIFVALFPLLGACASSDSTGDATAPAQDQPAVPVDVAKVTNQTVPIELQAVGSVQAYSTVNVTSQVSGPLDSVHFKEGQTVQEGDLLFVIDRRPFQAALDQAEAELQKQRALLNQARADLVKDQAQEKTAQVEAKRYASLLEKGVVTKEQYDQERTNAETLEASVKADRAAIGSAVESVKSQQAAVESAKLQLSYTSIFAPISGLTGAFLVQPGNIVQADTTVLVVINQIRPIYVAFSVPEQHLEQIRGYMAKGKPKVVARPSGGEGEPVEGELTFMDNTANPSTGTIGLKGTFPNTRQLLWPGQFVNVVLTLAQQTGALVVPSQAVQTSQTGEYVYVVKPNMTVESRSVTVDRTVGSLAVISKGLRLGEQVVTDGQLRLFPGAKVEIRNGASASDQQEASQ
jgi:membrane fusion protein, multidrug efflux system